MKIYNIFTAATGAQTSPVFKLEESRSFPIPITLTQATPATAFVGTVLIQGAIASDQEVREGSAKWVTLSSKTAPAAYEISAPYTHIRAVISAYASGSIYCRTIF